jgi:PAS domain S-box-containing protein
VRTSSAGGNAEPDATEGPGSGINGKAAAPLTLGQKKNGFAQELLRALPVAVYTTDADGRITSFNDAAVDLWGCRPELGKSEYCGSYRLYWADGTLLPHDQCPMAMTLREKRPIRGMEALAERPDGTRVPLIPYPTPLFDEAGALIGAVNIVVDISERKRAEEALAKHRDEQAALHEFTDKLYHAETASDVYESALDAMTRALGCSRASVLLFDDAGVMRFAAWRGLSDGYRSAVEGHSPWTRDVKGPEPLCIQNVEMADLSDSLKATVKREGIGSLAFIPLMAKGVLVGRFMTHYEVPHAFSEAELDLAVTIARQLGFAIERMCTDYENRLLASIIASSDAAIVSKDLNGIVTSWNRGAEQVFGYAAQEIIGRPITTLIPDDRHNEEVEILDRIRREERLDHYEAIRQQEDGSIVGRSLAGKNSVEDADAAVINRLRSLAQTHEMSVDRQWQGADLAELVCTEMSPYVEEGPALVLSARAENFALALHELATNAAEYDALSNATGGVHISWSTAPSNGSRLLTFCGQEQGGPPVSPAPQKGFGSAVLEQVMTEHFDVSPRIDFRVGGVRYELDGGLESLTTDTACEARQKLDGPNSG